MRLHAMRPSSARPREGGDPEPQAPSLRPLDSRFRGNERTWHRGALACIATLALLTALPAAVDATSNRAYKPNEYVVIRDGLAPSKKFSVRAHGNGELGDEDFHLYLMAEPGA